MSKMRTMASALVAACLVLVPGASALAADRGWGITEDLVRAGLPDAERAVWDALTDAERALTVQVLEDVEFGDPAAARSVEARWDVVDVVEEQASEGSARSLQRSHWFNQRWTILGITYTEVRTTVGWWASGSRVLEVNRCYGTYTNYVPLRSISSASWSEQTATTATCRTEWTLGRPLQPVVRGVQGLRVSGDGVLLLVWRV